MATTSRTPDLPFASGAAIAGAPFALAGAMVEPVAGLAGGAALGLLALFGRARGEHAAACFAAGLLGVGVLFVANEAFVFLAMAALALFGARSIRRSIALAKSGWGDAAS